ncbi:MAG TPA: hypothetical protein VHP11_06725 [Tepidisphaeraceae bacterium]|nr:hypothetical protein [Tepidisphaeraceae bacterium]
MKLRVLVAHNHYQQPGGEDEVYASEAECLEAFGHEVVRYALHNNQVREMRPLPLAAATFWNQQTYREVRELVRQHRIAVAHFHNTFPLISPSAYSAAHAEGAAVVQTLHNFRLLCINATLFRHGRVCERCVGRTSAWPGVVYGCYRGSWGASAVAATAMATHWALGTWQRSVDLFITPSPSMLAMFLRV